MAVVADVGGLLAHLGENHDGRLRVGLLQCWMAPTQLVSQH